jgi:hypothetical protein
MIGARLSSGLASILKLVLPYLIDKIWNSFVEYFKTMKMKKEQEKVNADNVKHDAEVMKNGSIDEIAQSTEDLLNGNKRP